MSTAAGTRKLTKARANSARDDVWKQELCACLQRRTGIVIQPHQGAALHAAVMQACQRFGLSDAAEVVTRLREARDGSPLFDLIIDQVTVQESFFFRDQRQIKALREQVLPALIENKTRQGNLTLRFWSAGCSLGQEIYTLAILLADMLEPVTSWRIHLLGTDINPVALAGASEGRYSKWSMRSTPADVIKRFFVATEDGYEIQPALKANIRFKILNLNDRAHWDRTSDTRNLDLILCRNVFIYLDEPTIERVLEQFARCLASGGKLILGASDFIRQPPPGMALCRYGEVQCLEKRAPGKTVNGNAVTAPPVAATAPAPIHRSRADAHQATASHKLPVKTVDIAPAPMDLAAMAEWFQCGEWKMLAAQGDTLMRAQCDHPGAWIWCGLAHANLGEREVAIECFERALALDQDAWLAQLGLGLVFCDADRLLEAEEVLKNARYLHPERPEAHYHLAVIRRMMGRKREARRSFGTALDLARHGDPRAHLLHLPQTCFADLIVGLEAELCALDD